MMRVSKMKTSKVMMIERMMIRMMKNQVRNLSIINKKNLRTGNRNFILLYQHRIGLLPR